MPTFVPGCIWVPRWRTRMLPARTDSPPKRFTPRRLLWESRPLRVEPPAFLCAMCALPEKRGQSAGAEIRDLHFREGLAMVLPAQVVLAAAEFDDRHLLALAVANDRGDDLAALEQRGAELHIGAIAHEQDLTELHRGAWLGIQLFDAQRGVLGNPVLLTTGGDDRVHEGYSGKDHRLDERSRILLSDPHPVKPGFPQA